MTIWPNTLLQPLDHIFGTALAAWLLPDVWERLQFNLCRFLMDRTSSCKLEVETLMCFFAYLVGSKKVLGHFWYLGSSWQADQLSMLGLKGFNQLVSISCRSGWPKSVSRWPIMFLSCLRYLLQYSDVRPYHSFTSQAETFSVSWCLGVFVDSLLDGLDSGQQVYTPEGVLAPNPDRKAMHFRVFDSQSRHRGFVAYSSTV